MEMLNQPKIQVFNIHTFHLCALPACVAFSLIVAVLPLVFRPND